MVFPTRGDALGGSLFVPNCAHLWHGCTKMEASNDDDDDDYRWLKRRGALSKLAIIIWSATNFLRIGFLRTRSMCCRRILRVSAAAFFAPIPAPQDDAGGVGGGGKRSAGCSRSACFYEGCQGFPEAFGVTDGEDGQDI